MKNQVKLTVLTEDCCMLINIQVHQVFLLTIFLKRDSKLKVHQVNYSEITISSIAIILKTMLPNTNK